MWPVFLSLTATIVLLLVGVWWGRGRVGGPRRGSRPGGSPPPTSPTRGNSETDTDTETEAQTKDRSEAVQPKAKSDTHIIKGEEGPTTDKDLGTPSLSDRCRKSPHVHREKRPVLGKGQGHLCVVFGTTTTGSMDTCAKAGDAVSGSSSTDQDNSALIGSGHHPSDQMEPDRDTHPDTVGAAPITCAGSESAERLQKGQKVEFGGVKMSLLDEASECAEVVDQRSKVKDSETDRPLSLDNNSDKMMSGSSEAKQVTAESSESEEVREESSKSLDLTDKVPASATVTNESFESKQVIDKSPDAKLMTEKLSETKEMTDKLQKSDQTVTQGTLESERMAAKGAPGESSEAAGAPVESSEAAGAPVESSEATGAPSESSEYRNIMDTSHSDDSFEHIEISDYVPEAEGATAKSEKTTDDISESHQINNCAGIMDAPLTRIEGPGAILSASEEAKEVTVETSDLTSESDEGTTESKDLEEESSACEDVTDESFEYNEMSDKSSESEVTTKTSANSEEVAAEAYTYRPAMDESFDLDECGNESFENEFLARKSAESKEAMDEPSKEKVVSSCDDAVATEESSQSVRGTQASSQNETSSHKEKASYQSKEAGDTSPSLSPTPGAGIPVITISGPDDAVKGGGQDRNVNDGSQVDPESRTSFQDCPRATNEKPDDGGAPNEVIDSMEGDLVARETRACEVVPGRNDDTSGDYAGDNDRVLQRDLPASFPDGVCTENTNPDYNKEVSANGGNGSTSSTLDKNKVVEVHEENIKELMPVTKSEIIVAEEAGKSNMGRVTAGEGDEIKLIKQAGEGDEIKVTGKDGESNEVKIIEQTDEGGDIKVAKKDGESNDVKITEQADGRDAIKFTERAGDGTDVKVTDQAVENKEAKVTEQIAEDHEVKVTGKDDKGNEASSQYGNPGISVMANIVGITPSVTEEDTDTSDTAGPVSQGGKSELDIDSQDLSGESKRDSSGERVVECEHSDASDTAPQSPQNDVIPDRSVARDSQVEQSRPHADASLNDDDNASDGEELSANSAAPCRSQTDTHDTGHHKQVSGAALATTIENCDKDVLDQSEIVEEPRAEREDRTVTCLDTHDIGTRLNSVNQVESSGHLECDVHSDERPEGVGHRSVLEDTRQTPRTSPSDKTADPDRDPGESAADTMAGTATQASLGDVGVDPLLSPTFVVQAKVTLGGVHNAHGSTASPSSSALVAGSSAGKPTRLEGNRCESSSPQDRVRDDQPLGRSTSGQSDRGDNEAACDYRQTGLITRTGEDQHSTDKKEAFTDAGIKLQRAGCDHGVVTLLQGTHPGERQDMEKADDNQNIKMAVECQEPLPVGGINASVGGKRAVTVIHAPHISPTPHQVAPLSTTLIRRVSDTARPDITSRVTSLARARSIEGLTGAGEVRSAPRISLRQSSMESLTSGSQPSSIIDDPKLQKPQSRDTKERDVAATQSQMATKTPTDVDSQKRNLVSQTSFEHAPQDRKLVKQTSLPRPSTHAEHITEAEYRRSLKGDSSPRVGDPAPSARPGRPGLLRADTLQVVADMADGLRDVNLSLREEVSRRKRAEEWADFLTDELQAHIDARTSAEERYFATRRKFQLLYQAYRGMRNRQGMPAAGDRDVFGTDYSEALNLLSPIGKSSPNNERKLLNHIDEAQEKWQRQSNRKKRLSPSFTQRPMSQAPMAAASPTRVSVVANRVQPLSPKIAAQREWTSLDISDDSHGAAPNETYSEARLLQDLLQSDSRNSVKDASMSTDDSDAANVLSDSIGDAKKTWRMWEELAVTTAAANAVNGSPLKSPPLSRSSSKLSRSGSELEGSRPTSPMKVPTAAASFPASHAENSSNAVPESVGGPVTSQSGFSARSQSFRAASSATKAEAMSTSQDDETPIIASHVDVSHTSPVSTHRLPDSIDGDAARIPFSNLKSIWEQRLV